MSKFSNKPFNDFKTRSTVYEFLRFAEVVRVDYFKMTCDIRYLDADNYATDVIISSNSHYISSFGGGMPEIGSFCIVFYSRQHHDRGYPVILGFVPRALFLTYDNEPIHLKPYAEDPYNLNELKVRTKNWKLYPGDFWFSSKDGSDLRIDDSFFMQDMAMDEILLDPYTQTISLNSYTQVLNSKAGKLSFGFVERNDLINSDFRDQFEDVVQYLSNGRKIFRVHNGPKSLNSPFGTNKFSDPGINGYTEWKLDIQEFGDNSMDVFGETTHGIDLRPLTQGSGNDEDGRIQKPLVSITAGTLVGNDSVSKEGKSKYGKILHPATFSDNYSRLPDSIIGDDVIVEDQNGIGAEQKIAGAFQLKIPNRRTTFSFTKEGVLEFTLDKSSAAHPLGADRSANIAMLGSLKMQVGKQALDAKSLILDLLGGASINIGSESNQNRSLDLIMSNGLNFEIQGADTDRLSIRGRVKNNIDLILEGNKYTELYGDDIQMTKGKVEQQIQGKLVQNIVNDHSKNLGGSYKETIVKDSQSSIGLGRKVTIAQPNILNGDDVSDYLKILLGNKELEMFLGNYDEHIFAGNHTEDIDIGNKNTNITIGNYKLKVNIGNITAETDTGNIKIGTKAGNVNVDGINITLTGLASTKIMSPVVQVGSLTQGGVVNSGPAGHRDYLTGLLLLGSSSVTCNTI